MCLNNGLGSFLGSPNFFSPSPLGSIWAVIVWPCLSGEAYVNKLPLPLRVLIVGWGCCSWLLEMTGCLPMSLLCPLVARLLHRNRFFAMSLSWPLVAHFLHWNRLFTMSLSCHLVAFWLHLNQLLVLLSHLLAPLEMDLCYIFHLPFWCGGRGWIFMWKVGW